MPSLAFGLEGEVDHHDGVFLHDADQQDDADQRDDAEFRAAEHQSQDGAHARGRQRGENRDGMNVALVQNSQHDVNRDQRGENQDWFVGERILESCGGALEHALDAGRHVRGRALTLLMPSTASPSEAPGARLKDSVTTGIGPGDSASAASLPGSMRVKALSGTCGPVEECT